MVVSLSGQWIIFLYQLKTNIFIRKIKMSDNANEQQNQPVFEPIRIYAKDCSLETPNVPQIFNKEWKPEIKVDFDAKPVKLTEGNYEVDLRVNVTCKIAEETAFICEVHQAGIFMIAGVDEPTLQYLLCAVAPNILFPYAREHVSSLINRASFPPFTLRPMNFEAMYRARQAELAAEAAKNQDVANGAAPEQAPQA